MGILLGRHANNLLPQTGDIPWPLPHYLWIKCCGPVSGWFKVDLSKVRLGRFLAFAVTRIIISASGPAAVSHSQDAPSSRLNKAQR